MRERHADEHGIQHLDEKLRKGGSDEPEDAHGERGVHGGRADAEEDAQGAMQAVRVSK
jgi:hypothetical protein